MLGPIFGIVVFNYIYMYIYYNTIYKIYKGKSKINKSDGVLLEKSTDPIAFVTNL